VCASVCDVIYTCGVALFYCWLMAASKELCSVCAKPLYRKQKTIRCGACDVHFLCACIQITDIEQVFCTNGLMLCAFKAVHFRTQLTMLFFPKQYYCVV
jgi:hypothetical protein